MTVKRIAQTIVVDEEQQQVLLAYHKTGEFAGHYIGFLGYMADDERPEEAAVRIPMEQCGIAVTAPELRAILVFTADDYGRGNEYEFYAGGFSGEPRDSDSIRPQWFAFDQIPYRQMPADDEIWYPPFLAGKCLRGHFYFAPGMMELLRHELMEVEAL